MEQLRLPVGKWPVIYFLNRCCPQRQRQLPLSAVCKASVTGRETGDLVLLPSLFLRIEYEHTGTSHQPPFVLGSRYPGVQWSLSQMHRRSPFPLGGPGEVGKWREKWAPFQSTAIFKAVPAWLWNSVNQEWWLHHYLSKIYGNRPPEASVCSTHGTEEDEEGRNMVKGTTTEHSALVGNLISPL